MRKASKHIRLEALKYVTAFHFEDVAEALSAATLVADFLAAPTVLRIRVGLVRDQLGGAVAEQPEGVLMQLHDNQQVTYAVEALDAKGYEVVGESFSASSSDETVVTVTQDGATFTAVAGAPGSAVLTFSDGNISATESVDVVAGDVATVQITPGDVTTQP